MRGIGEIGGADEVFGRVGVGGQPIAIVAAAVPFADQIRAMVAAPLDPRVIAGRCCSRMRRVAIGLVDGPGADDARIAPGGRASRAVFGRDIGEGAVARLGVVDINQPFGEERGHVGVRRGGADKDLGVAHPAQPFVALRAIGGHAEVVAALAPLDVGLKLIDPRVGAGELARCAACRCRSPRRSERIEVGFVGRPVTST